MTSGILRALAAVVALGTAAPGPWRPDRGDGTYANPVIHADYSDPDVVRVGDDFYLTASSFGAVPALPILHSRDLVNWTLVGHAAPRLPSPDFDTPQHGKGVWAPSLRHHGGFFWIYYGDPDRGIYMTRARDPRGPWEPLHLVHAARGWIDPCPLWDDDGRMYLVHAWAKSRAGFNSVLHVRPLSPDGRRVIGDGAQVFDGTARHPTIEGPKFYKRNGWYYVFAPAGGVEQGWQTVLRSRGILGPYEDRIVLERGATAVNGPHQGGWVDTPGGQDWFVHFQDKGAYGRIVHLQPMRWKGDWPVMGEDPDGDGKGQPVLTHAKPAVRGMVQVAMPATSDEFDSDSLGLQWQWQANPDPSWASVQGGALRLRAVATTGPNLWAAGSLLLQKWPAPAFTARARLDPSGLRVGDEAGLVVFGLDYATLAVERTARGLAVHRKTCARADEGAAETIAASTALDGPTDEVYGAADERAYPMIAAEPIELIVEVVADASCRFAYAQGGKRRPIGGPFTAKPGRWVGAKIGLYAKGAGEGHADFDWFRVE